MYGIDLGLVSGCFGQDWGSCGYDFALSHGYGSG
jgi:hypothetical protein